MANAIPGRSWNHEQDLHRGPYIRVGLPHGGVELVILRAQGIGLVVVAASTLLLVASCGGEDEADGSANRPIETSTRAPTNTPAAAATSTTVPTVSATEDTLSQFLTDTVIEWEGCELLVIDDGSFTAACGYRTHPFFENWLVQIWYAVDDDGNKVGVSGSVIRGYGTTCEWGLPEGDAYDAPLVAGIATYEGILLGSGLCDGLQWSFTQVWDDDAHALVTSGKIERRD